MWALTELLSLWRNSVPKNIYKKGHLYKHSTYIGYFSQSMQTKAERLEISCLLQTVELVSILPYYVFTMFQPKILVLDHFPTFE